MTQSIRPLSIALRRSSAPAPEHSWVSNGSTLNPSPGPLLKERRDTADGCRDRATADLLEAVTMATAHSRRMLERSAASWSQRAELLQRMESSIDTRLNPFELTDAELAEDAAHVRS
jgi:hypothetical protein